MKIWKSITITLLFVLLLTFLFLFSWGWIPAIVFGVMIIVLLFINWGGSFPNSILNFLKNNSLLRRIEKQSDEEIENYGKHVAIGLSGGVDSAVAAHILLKKGYEVTGFFMKNWDRATNQENNNILTEEEICSIEQDWEDAKKTADQLGIKLIKINFVKEYWNLVFSSFLRDIEEGKTPNPDILCNRYIKFGKMISHITEEYPDIDYIATGHYASIEKNDDKYYLKEAKDPIKDQTYFLAEVDKKIFSKILFPLAKFDKSEVRAIANLLHLEVANKKDSIGICFIGKRKFAKFMENYLDKQIGNIVKTETNKVIGKHQGVNFYTIGQRKGLSLGGQTKAHFVSGKDVAKNILYVSERDNEEKHLKDKITAINFNDLSDDINSFINKDLEVKTRHSATKYDARLLSVKTKNDIISITIKTNKKVEFVTPGQELVLYHESICLGGGVIV